MLFYAYFQPKKPDTKSAGVTILNENGIFIAWRGVKGKADARRIAKEFGASCTF